ncbi:MAG: CAP domain-containing protein [Candidatus Staskawiczbacteria bacterium]
MDYSSKEDTIDYIFDKTKMLILPSKENNFKSKILQSKFLLYCVVLVMTLRIVMSLVSINTPQNLFFADITKSTLENFINQTRQSVGLGPLTKNLKLEQAAQLKAENMVQNNYFNHTSPTGVTPWFWFLKAGYSYKFAGENLAIGFYDSQEVYNAWLNSPSHKANIVNPNYTEVGTAILTGFGENNSIVVVQEFASPKVTIVKNNNPTQVVTKNTQTSTTGTETLNTDTNTATVTKKTNINTKTPTSNIDTATSKTDTKTINAKDEKVLSETTRSDSFIESPTINKAINNISARVMNSVLYNYDGLLQNIVYGLSLIVMGILITLILFNFKISFTKPLVYRVVLLVILLSTATLVDNEILISLIPHQLLI